MDFLALPRRDLQALCKLNGVRANMTNVAMADALRALPKVDGIEEYVKQPVPVPGPEEKNVWKQGNPLPHGRRAVAKSSEPVEPEEENEDEKGNAKRQSSKEDAQALGVERRGASRRARLVPVVPQLAAMAEEALKREAKRDSAPAPVLGRRGASRRARPSPALAAESEVAGAEEEQRTQIPGGRRVRAKGSSSEPIRLDDRDDEEKEDAEPEEQQEDAQILGVGRRGGASRRAQAAPAVAAPEAKAEEEQTAPVPRCRRVKANSTELIRLDNSKEEQKQDTKPEEEKGDAPAIAVGRRGASRRAPAPSEVPATRSRAAASNADAGDVSVEAVSIRVTRQRKPTMKAAAVAAAQEKAPPRRATRRGAVMSTLLQHEVQEESQEALGAPDVALEVEEVPIRATRQRKPTMKAAAAAMAEEKVPQRATRRGAVMRSVLQPEAQEEPQEPVGATVSYQQCDALLELEEASDPQKEELNKQDEDQGLVIISDEKLMEETLAEEPPVNDQERKDKSGMQEQLVDNEKYHAPLAIQEKSPILGLVSMVTEQASEDDKEAVGALVSQQRCDALEELAKVSDPQKEEFNAVDTPKQDEDQDAIIIEGEKLMEETTTEEPSVADREWTDSSEMQEQQVDNEKCHALLATQEESLTLGLVSTVTEQAYEDDVGASFQDDGGFSSGLLDKGVCSGKTCDAGEEIELVSGVQTLQAPLTGNESNVNHESEIGNFNEVPTFREEISEVDTQEVSKEKEHMDIADLLSDIVDEAAFLDCSSNISQVVEEEINEQVNTAGVQTNEEVNTEDGLGGQREGDVVVDKVLHDWVDNTNLLDCSSDISARKDIVLLDGVTESLSKSIITMEPSVCKNGSGKRKNSAEPMAVLEEKGVKVASQSEDLTKLSLGQLRAKLKEKLNAKKNKEAKKRVALARVDETVCRSRAKGAAAGPESATALTWR